jgi:predicted nucleic-acid-binding Zn-ribbon protein
MTEKTMDSPENDEARAALTCLRCGIRSSILFGPEPPGFVEQLPDPVEWQCRFCGYKTFYPKSAITMLTPEHEAKSFDAK